MATVIRLENLGKRYRLGSINRRMLYEDAQRWWARARRKPDPFAPVQGAESVSMVEGSEQPKSPGTDEIWALESVNLEVSAGDVVGIIGRNGSGKSTLLKILSKITAPTRGRAFIKGRVASLLEVGTGFHPELTGRENVYMNASILGMTKAEIDARFAQIVEFAEVEKFIDTPVKRYSSGMMVRLAFAVAAHLDPEILIIDEVLAVGDSTFQQKCLGRIGTVAREGRTILFVSHNAAAVQNLCQRGVVLDQGRVAFDGSQSAALEFYGRSNDRQENSLRNRRDRSGNGAVRIVEIEYRVDGVQKVTGVRSGQDLEIVLHYERQDSHLPASLNARIHVSNQFELPVFMQHNALSGDSFGTIPKTGAFVCRIPRLPLPAGRYRISFYITSGYHRGCDYYDRMINACDLVVEGGDFFGTGEIPSAGEATCLVDAKWSVADSGSAPTVGRS